MVHILFQTCYAAGEEDATTEVEQWEEEGGGGGENPVMDLILLRRQRQLTAAAATLPNDAFKMAFCHRHPPAPFFFSSSVEARQYISRIQISGDASLLMGASRSMFSSRLTLGDIHCLQPASD